MKAILVKPNQERQDLTEYKEISATVSLYDDNPSLEILFKKLFDHCFGFRKVSILEIAL
jgi:hypothetical protein